MYPHSWAKAYRKLFQENTQTDSELQWLQIGETHTLAVNSSGKVYSWGWNDVQQLGVSRKNSLFPTLDSLQVHQPLTMKNIKMAVAGSSHNYALDYNNNLYYWGGNLNFDQSGRSSVSSQNQAIRLVPHDFPINSIYSKGENTVLLSQTGAPYHFSPQTNPIPTPFSFTFPTSIVSVSCGMHFLIFICKSGQAFSLGSSNTEGELGLGDRLPRASPTPIVLPEPLQSAACGYRHVIARGASGKLFVWGWGKLGQLGHGSLVSEMKPVRLTFTGWDTCGKPAQIQAGYGSSVVLFENRRVFWWGSNGSLYRQKRPIEMALSEKNRGLNEEFSVVRVTTSWTKTMGVAFCTVADLRGCDMGTQIKGKTLGTLMTKWAKEGYSDGECFF